MDQKVSANLRSIVYVLWKVLMQDCKVVNGMFRCKLDAKLFIFNANPTCTRTS